MSKPTLSNRMKNFRIDRPSEWLMDDFIRDAKEQEQELASYMESDANLRKRVEELEAENRASNLRELKLAVENEELEALLGKENEDG